MADTDTRKLLLIRKAELAAHLPKLEASRDKLRLTWVETTKTIATVKEELRRIDSTLSTWEEADARSAKPTIMEAVQEVLRHAPDGLTALEILSEINAKYFDGRILRTSLSPQLSRLKDRDHKITLRGNRWYLLEEEPSLFKRRI